MDRIRDLRHRARQALGRAEEAEELDRIRVEYLGKKGALTKILRGMSSMDPDLRPTVGQEVNAAKEDLESLLESRAEEILTHERERRLMAESLDVTLPGRQPLVGHAHPLEETAEEMERVFSGLGFQVAEGPEVEYDEYNFEMLNIPRDHPARDMQDTFYVTEDVVLRTHTSPVQIRYMRKHAPHLPVRIIAPGRVYRRDDDPTHSPMFHQVEGLLVDRDVTMGDLKGTLLMFAREMFGPDTSIRLRPSYFPFTEPSAEVDFSCTLCGGRGCRTCGGSGWLEIVGAGMVHPQVLLNGGYDPEEVSGFAFGMGIDRVCMLRYGLDDLRLLFQGDYRFIRQF